MKKLFTLKITFHSTDLKKLLNKIENRLRKFNFTYKLKHVTKCYPNNNSSIIDSGQWIMTVTPISYSPHSVS